MGAIGSCVCGDPAVTSRCLTGCMHALARACPKLAESSRKVVGPGPRPHSPRTAREFARPSEIPLTPRLDKLAADETALAEPYLDQAEQITEIHHAARRNPRLGPHYRVASQVPVSHSGGFAPDVEPAENGKEEYLGGDGPTSNAPVASPTSAAPTPSAGAPLSADTTISTGTVHGPTWSPHGSFRWDENFTTTGRNGWIVQEIVNTMDATQVIPTPGIPAGSKLIPGAMDWHYFEAWAVDGSGNVTPGDGNGNDTWGKPGLGPGTKGTWTMAGYAHFARTDPATQGLTPGGSPNARQLSGHTAPPGLGFVLWERHADGTWDSSGSTPTHTGKAGGLTP